MGNMLLPILMFAGVGLMMFFNMKKQKRTQAAAVVLRDSMVPGTRVMTTSGMHATVTAIADDTIELEIAPGIRTTWVRAAVREIVVATPLEDELAEFSDESVEPLHDDSPALLKKRSDDAA